MEQATCISVSLTQKAIWFEISHVWVSEWMKKIICFSSPVRNINGNNGSNIYEHVTFCSGAFCELTQFYHVGAILITSIFFPFFFIGSY